MDAVFSVIITTYNRPVKIIRAIKSILEQTFQDFEIIIVNDGSFAPYDEAEEVANSDGRVRYFYKQNEERSVARNFGVKKAKGKFICFLDDDDYYLPNHLQVLYDGINSKDFVLGFYHTYSVIKNRENKFEYPKFTKHNPSITIQEYYATEGMMTMNSTCGAKVIFEEFPYDSNLIFAEDHNQRLRAMSKYPVFQINEYTNVYDMSEETSTTKSDIKVILGYIYSWRYNFSQDLIKNFVSPSVKKHKLHIYYHHLINNHRLELSTGDFLSACINFFMFKPSFKSLKIVFDNVRWKLSNR